MKYCQKCLYPENHPLGITFNDEGICSGCQVHQEKYTLDFQKKFNDLRNLVRDYKQDKSYDCIVPVRGDAESYFTLHIVVNKLKLNPLLVFYNSYYNSSLGFMNLANLRNKFNCDILIQNVDYQCVKKITRETLINLGSVYWHVHAGRTAFPVQIAVKYKIPLIIWGAHQGIEQVGMFSHEENVEMSRWYRKNHDLMGYEATDLVEDFGLLSLSDVDSFIYPDLDQIQGIGVRGIYLSNFIPWDPLSFHSFVSQNYGFIGGHLNRTFDVYDNSDCLVYTGIHDYLKYIKCGYSKITDHISREIRHGRISRPDGLQIQNLYLSQKIKYIDYFKNFLEISSESLNFILSNWMKVKPWQFEEIERMLPEALIGGKKISLPDDILGLIHVDQAVDIESGPDGAGYIIFGKGMA